jgi:hypothetical protein
MICIRHIDVERVDTNWLLHVEAWLNHIESRCETIGEPTQYKFGLYFASLAVEDKPPVDFLDLKKLIYELNSAGKLNWEIINPDDY